MAAGQMFVNMNMNITTCGAHSGLIVHSGVHQGKADATLIWPYPMNIQPTASFPFPNATLPLQQQQQQQRQSQQQSLPWRKESSCSTNRTNSFRGVDSPPSEFIEPDNVQLNVFNVDPVNYSSHEAKKLESENKPTVEHRPEAVLDDAVTTTTTVEVFRTKVDPNNPNEYITLPPVPAPGMEGRPQVLRALGPDYERWTTSRTETLINEPIKWQEQSGLRTSSEALPHNENCASTAFIDRHTYTSSASSPPAQYRTARDGISVNKRKHVRMSQGSPFYANHSQMETNGRHEEENVYEMARSRSVEDVRSQYAPDYTHQHSRPRNEVPIYEAPLSSSLRRSEGVRTSTTPKVAKSEEIFHLYETRDACGNIRAKCETTIDLRDEQIPTSAGFNFLDDSITSQTAFTCSPMRSDILGERIITTPPYSDEPRGYTSPIEDALIPYYSIQNATRSTTETYTYPQNLERYPENLRPQVSPSNFTSTYESRNLGFMREICETNPPRKPNIKSATLQPPVESKNIDTKFDEIHVHDTNTTSLLGSEKYNFLLDNAYLRYPILMPNDDSVHLHLKLDDELRRTNFALEAISQQPKVSLEVLPEISILDSQIEDVSTQMEILGNDDTSYRKKVDVPKVLNEFSQNEAKYAEVVSPTYEEFSKFERESDSLRLISDNSDAHKCSMLEDVAYQISMADMFDYTSSLQVGESEQPSRYIDGLISFHSPPYVIPHSPKPDSETPAISSQATFDQFIHNEDENSTSDSVHERDSEPGANTIAVKSALSCTSSVESTISSDDESKYALVIPELKQQYEELTPKSLSTNSSISHIFSELEHSMSIAEKESVIEENDGEVVRENIQTTSSEGFLDANDNQTTDIPSTDIPIAPSRSILHVDSRSKRQRKYKSVRFPSREPQVIVNEHRLFITGIESDQDSDST